MKPLYKLSATVPRHPLPQKLTSKITAQPQQPPKYHRHHPPFSIRALEANNILSLPQPHIHPSLPISSFPLWITYQTQIRTSLPVKTHVCPSPPILLSVPAFRPLHPIGRVGAGQFATTAGALLMFLGAANPSSSAQFSLPAITTPCCMSPPPSFDSIISTFNRFSGLVLDKPPGVHPSPEPVPPPRFLGAASGRLPAVDLAPT